MNKYIMLPVKAISTGLLLIILVYLSSLVVSKSNFNLKPVLPAACAAWNDNHIMEITTFLAGVLLYVIVQVADLKRFLL